MRLMVMMVGLALGGEIVLGQQVPAADEQELRKRQAEFREAMERFRNSREYWEQRAVFERLVGEAKQSGGVEKFSREIEEAASKPETRIQRQDMDRLVRSAAARAEKQPQQNR